MKWGVLLACSLASALACSKNDAASRLAQASLSLSKHQPEQALVELKQALDLATGEANLVYRCRALRAAADTYFLELHDPRQAAQVYRELIEVCPEAPETLDGRLHLAAVLEHHLQDRRGAIAELTAALARNPPQSAELSYKIASLYFQIQDFQQCQLEAANTARRYETSAFVDDALYLRAQALMMDGKMPEAQKAYAEFVDRFVDSPLRAHALFDLGATKAESGERERAIELWIESLKTHPKPEVVQVAIARVRAQLRVTMPVGVGNAAKAFDRLPVAAASPVVAKPKTSVEAVGGTQEEAEREAKMKVDGVKVEKASNANGTAPAETTQEE